MADETTSANSCVFAFEVDDHNDGRDVRDGTVGYDDTCSSVHNSALDSCVFVQLFADPGRTIPEVRGYGKSEQSRDHFGEPTFELYSYE